MKTVFRVLKWGVFYLFTFIVALVIATGVVGGIMYLNEKLNQFGTILIGG